MPNYGIFSWVATGLSTDRKFPVSNIIFTLVMILSHSFIYFRNGL